MAEESKNTAEHATGRVAGSLQVGTGGRFDLLGELGSGSSGTVYRARLRQPYAGLPADTEVAVKFLRQDLLADDRARARLQAEGELGQALRHPNVAAIFGVESLEVLGVTLTWLVMELVSGTTLRAFLQHSGPPVEDLTRRIGADAAAGLHALHKRGIVHRDVKPENLILTPAGELKVVDLGLARPFGARGMGSASSSGGGLAGTVAYAAPEALRGQPTSARSDLYALGVVLFEVATGKHPFAQARTPDEMIHAQMFTAPPRPSHLRPRMSPLLDQMILELLQKDPDRRPRDAADVARTLQHGEHSEWWRKHVQNAPALASGRRLQRMRRPAETPLFGRDAELAALDLLLAKARAGFGQVVCVSGPQGIGRRRLLDEAMARWLPGSADLLYLGGEADAGLGHGEPFASTLIDWLLRGDGRDSPNATARAEARARSDLGLSEADAQALATVAMGHSKEPPEVRADRLASALLLLPRKDRVLVLRVDSADKLDTSGRLALQRLVAALSRRHVLLLLTAGPDGLQHVTAERFDLAGLGEVPFGNFGRALFRDDAVGKPFLEAAWTVLAGNPGNLIEALEHLTQQGQLRGRPGDYHDLADDAEVRPAPGLIGRFEARVARMNDGQRKMLTAAAVLGERCQLADLAALVNAPELLVLETLSLFRGRIIRAQAGEVAFRHRDFRQALLRLLTDSERRDLHQRAAEQLAARGGSPLAIGLHRSHALDHEGCVDPLLQGLEELVASGSRRTSLRIAARLRIHFEELPDDPSRRRQRLRFLLLWARARQGAGQADLAATTFQQALELAGEHATDDPVARGQARTGLAGLALNDGRMPEARTLLEQAHGELDGDGDDRTATLAALAHGMHARILLYLGRAEEGLRHLQTALRQLPRQENDLWCHLQIDLARMEALRHHYPTALKTLQKVEQQPEARHLPRVRMRLHLYRGQIRAALGDDGAVQDLQIAADEAARLSLLAYGARAWLFLAERAFWRQRDDEARTLLRRAWQLAEDTGDRLGATLARIHLHRLDGDDPDVATAVAALDLPSLNVAWQVTAAWHARQLGDHEAAGLHTEAAIAPLAATDLPLSLHLRALTLADRLASVRSLVRSIADRFPDRRSRRRFLGEWERGARV
ncbi:MAG: protein kinase [Planctomycetes bacterium]|nr:protein kinase [Planctomycetota bacterium]